MHQDPTPDEISAPISPEIEKPEREHRLAEVINGLSSLESKIDQGIERLATSLTTKSTYDEFKERQIESLHAELQQYRSDLLGKAMRPIFSSLIRLHGDSGRLVSDLRARPPGEIGTDTLFSLFDEFREDIQRLLADFGATAFEHGDAGDPFDGRRQQAVGFVDEGGGDRHGTIATRVAPGFEYGETLLQKEKVTVFRRTPSTEERTHSGEEPAPPPVDGQNHDDPPSLNTAERSTQDDTKRSIDG